MGLTLVCYYISEPEDWMDGKSAFALLDFYQDLLRLPKNTYPAPKHFSISVSSLSTLM